MRKILLTLALICLPAILWSQGIPFIRNYSAAKYNAHKQNFDIITGPDGTVYVANFEGLIYFDNSQWRIIHTPGITRITAVFRDSKGRVWAGGYNYLGYVTPDKHGILQLETIDENNTIQGEVQWIWEREGKVSFLVSDGKIYDVKDRKVIWNKEGTLPKSGFTTLGTEHHVTQIQQLENGLSAVSTTGEGLFITDQSGDVIYKITEANGLCSNNVTHITYNGNGILWGATDNGIFSIAIPSVYSHFTPNEGLRGEVLSIARLNGDLYVGTLNGLYRMQGDGFVQVNEMTLACWQLVEYNGSLLAATADGVIQIRPTGITHLTTSNTTSVMIVDGGFYAGETDGVYRYDFNGHREKMADAERVTLMLKDGKGTIWLKNLYGHIWKSKDQQHFVPQTKGEDGEISTLVQYDGEVLIVKASTQEPFPYPLFSYLDSDGYTWLTNSKGKYLYALKHGYREKLLSDMVYPLMDYSVRAMLREGKHLWMGGDMGLNVLDYSQKDPVKNVKAKVYIRSVTLLGDSVLWGGYGQQPEQLAELSSDERHITIHYAVDYPSMLLIPQYRYRLNGGRWTAWDTETFEEFNNMPHGDYTFEVQSRDAYGRLSNIASISFSIARPFYLRWYMILLYAVLLGGIVYLLVQYRLHQLEREKHRLENLVKERTAEVVKLEKVATVAKLTQGLIDRILNPLTYNNNFAKLSQGLVKDIEANVEDEKENMDPENYEDTMDVLDMLGGNLQKVGEHGANTSRTLKAMEEILKDHSGGLVKMDLNALLKQDQEMLEKYFEKDIAQYHIAIKFNLPEGQLMINGNAEQLSKTIMSLLGNAVYAVIKKCEKGDTSPEITLTLTTVGQQAEIHIHDNGTGISENIQNKIFDPFFTTKTTGEASGVGLYLSKEIAQHHGGDITVKSEKGVYTEFTITIPTL